MMKWLAGLVGGIAPGWSAAIVMVALVIAVSTGYIVGRADMRADFNAALASDRVTILKDGKEIDDAAFTADDNALCELLGGC